MAEDRDELLRHDREMRADLLDAISGLSDAQLSEETLNGWSVKDHLAHLAFWDELRGTEIARISAGHTFVWRMSGGHDAAVNTEAYELGRELSVDQARWELTTMHQRILDAIAAATRRGLDPSLYGEAGLLSRRRCT